METTPLRSLPFPDRFGSARERPADHLTGHAVDGGDGIRVPAGPSLHRERGTRA
jgi:hypothetical protein